MIINTPAPPVFSNTLILYNGKTLKLFVTRTGVDKYLRHNRNGQCSCRLAGGNAGLSLDTSMAGFLEHNGSAQDKLAKIVCIYIQLTLIQNRKNIPSST